MLQHFLFTIVSSEKIVQYNGLSPENDLSIPGHAIPLAVGILFLIDSIGDLSRGPSPFIHFDMADWGHLLRQTTLGSL